MDLVKSLAHPGELWALLRFKFGGGKELVMPSASQDSLTATMQRCYELLTMTSRSFAAVIQALDGELRPAVCIFYLVLRALDTVEDDMSIPSATKTAMLGEFHTHLYQPDWSFLDSQEKDRAVLEEFPAISAEFRRLAPVFQEVIADITRRMGEGMTVFLEAKIDSLEQWDEYCHYVAGLVGIGLSQLFAGSGLESAEVGRDQQLANSMGLFLQKTNIIRDYLEDMREGRQFWPRQAWGQFAAELSDFTEPGRRERAVSCLNLLVTNALQHVPDVIQYMARIHNQSVFHFCAIPQTMAIATLVCCYGNPRVFSGVVKIRRGQAVSLMMASTDMASLKSIFAQYTRQVCARIDPSDPTADQTRALVEQILQLCGPAPPTSGMLQPHSLMLLAGLVATLAVLYCALWTAYL